MPLELLRYQLLLPTFALVLARVAGLVFSVPVLSSGQIPRIVKVWLSVTIALMAFPVVTPYLPHSLTLAQAAVGMVGEFIIGQVLGLGAGLIFFAAQMAGKVISHQSGMALGTAFNPLFDAESTVLDQLWFLTTLVLFFALRGHLAVITVLLGSFKTIPPMMATFDGALADFLVLILQNIFELALRLAGPTIIALLLTSLVMGFLTRTMPQMNVLSVGFNIKVVAALFIMALSISLSPGLLGDALFDSLNQVGLLFEHVSQGVIHGA